MLRLQHNLPADTFPFIGRELEIKELTHYLTSDAFRLISILGSGGMGKTRLALEVGRQLLPHFRDGVYFLSLASITTSEQIITTTAESIGFKFHSDEKPTQQLFDFLQKQHLLLIADNFEHLLDSADLLNDILQSAPKVKVLVTSREKLNLSGETAYSISGLSTPLQQGKVATIYDAVQLFMAVVNRTTPRIQAKELNAVARICQLLGGMPLAILLAAAWLDTLSLTEIEAEIQAGLGILEANLRDTPTRHHSIQATFDASWKRLSTQEQSVFMRMSMFRDGFTREAAQKVVGASIRDLQRLVHTSFIQLTPSGRYSIHELMRQYGEAKLHKSGEIDAVQEKHAKYFADFITPLGDTPWGMATREMLKTANDDFENMRAAWLYQVEQRNISELRRFLDGLWIFFDHHSRSQEGIELFEPLLTVFQNTSDETLFRGQVLGRISWFYTDIGQHQKAVEFAKQSLQIVKAFNAIYDILFVYESLFLVLPRVSEYQESLKYAQEGYALAQKYPASKWSVLFRVTMGQIYLDAGQDEEVQAVVQTLPDSIWRMDLQRVLLMKAGEYAQVEVLLLDALNKYPFHRIGYLNVYQHLTNCAVKTDNLTKAWAYIQRGLFYADDGSYAWGTLNFLISVSELLIVEEQYSASIQILSLVQNHPATMELIKEKISGYKEILKTKLSADEFETAWERGKELDLGDVLTDLMER